MDPSVRIDLEPRLSGADPGISFIHVCEESFRWTTGRRAYTGREIKLAAVTEMVANPPNISIKDSRSFVLREHGFLLGESKDLEVRSLEDVASAHSLWRWKCRKSVGGDVCALFMHLQSHGVGTVRDDSLETRFEEDSEGLNCAISGVEACSWKEILSEELSLLENSSTSMSKNLE